MLFILRADRSFDLRRSMAEVAEARCFAGRASDFPACIVVAGCREGSPEVPGSQQRLLLVRPTYRC